MPPKKKAQKEPEPEPSTDLRTECSCTDSEASVKRDVDVPKTLPYFVYDSPTAPSLILQTNFHCDDICDWKPDHLLDKMTSRWDDDTKRLCLTFLDDVRHQCQANTGFNNFQLLATVEMFFYTFKFVVNSKVANTQDTIVFFQEQLLRYAVEHPPRSLEVFSIEESYALLLFFEAILLPHLVLLRAITAPNVRITIQVAPDELFAKKGKKK